MDDRLHRRRLWLLILSVYGLVVLCGGVVESYTDPNDVAILRDWERGLENAYLLKWPSVNASNDPCGTKWPHVYCSGDRVSQIQVQDMGLKGALPVSFNNLTKLTNLGLQRNQFHGSLPTFKGLRDLAYAYLNDNAFDSIPDDFFHEVGKLQVLALDNNPLNVTVGWRIHDDLQWCKELVNLSMINCNLVGQLPEYLGRFGSLMELKLSSNRFVGEIPKSFGKSNMQVLWLNGQQGGLSGSIEVIASMTYLRQLWLDDNHFTGTIPGIGNLTALKELKLSGNNLVGVIPQSLGSLELVKLDISNNQLMGPIPKFKLANVTYDNNHFCQWVPGVHCSADVTALLGFLAAVNYPSDLVYQWSGNDPCSQPWVGINCNPQSKITRIVLPNRKLNGTLSPSISSLESLTEIKLGRNNLSGLVPESLKGLKTLSLLDLSDNNFEPPLPEFDLNVTVVIDGNPKFSYHIISTSPSPSPWSEVISPSDEKWVAPQQPPPQQQQQQISPPLQQQQQQQQIPPPPQQQIAPVKAPTYVNPPAPTFSKVPTKEVYTGNGSKNTELIITVAVLSGCFIIIIIFLRAGFLKFKCKKSNTGVLTSKFDHPKYPLGLQNAFNRSRILSKTLNSSGESSVEFYSCTLDSESVISVQILQKATGNFSPENVLGRGGYGVVYKGTFDDGTCIAVKRMEAGVFSKTAIDEFQSEISVLSKVRHRHLVALLGYSIEVNEKLLVYEYMPEGALSRHLFDWERLKLKPLSWATRLGIALDVARGVEYLHGLACESFIHRDLKSSNILLGNDFRAKVADFGLVKLAPDLGKSIATRVAGTFGYLAPEYAVMGKITTKSDVFSFGVVLLELLTGRKAVDETRAEESRYLAQWFTHIKSNKEKLLKAIDKTLDLKTDDSIIENIYFVAELAGYCTERDPTHRPDMGYVVNVLAPLVEKWQPVQSKHETESESSGGINLHMPLSEMINGWKDNKTKDFNNVSSIHSSSQGSSLPSHPIGLPSSLGSMNGR